MVCKLCNNQKKMARSHIIPKTFYKCLNIEPDDYLNLYSDNSKPKRRREGIYDKNILCCDCESETKYQKIDDNFIKYINTFATKYRKCKNTPLELAIEKSNIDLIKKFLLFTIWKEHHSNQATDVNLSTQDEAIIKQSILNFNYDLSAYTFIPYIKNDWKNAFIELIKPIKNTDILYYRIDIGKFYFDLNITDNINFSDVTWRKQSLEDSEKLNRDIINSIII